VVSAGFSPVVVSVVGFVSVGAELQPTINAAKRADVESNANCFMLMSILHRRKSSRGARIEFFLRFRLKTAGIIRGIAIIGYPLIQQE
jgi:hypothetical protein